jgi:hypothetical protein
VCYLKRVPKRIEAVPDKAVYSVAEMCVLLGYSRSTVIRIFEREPGVLIRLHPEMMHKRRRRKITIPRHVFLRVKPQIEIV